MRHTCSGVHLERRHCGRGVSDNIIRKSGRSKDWPPARVFRNRWPVDRNFVEQESLSWCIFNTEDWNEDVPLGLRWPATELQFRWNDAIETQTIAYLMTLKKKQGGDMPFKSTWKLPFDGVFYHVLALSWKKSIFFRRHPYRDFTLTLQAP